MSKKSSSKKQLLGKILLERNIINQSQLKHALAVQEEQEEYFGEILVGLGYVEEHDVVAALVIGEEWGVIGTLCLVTLYFLLIYASLNIANQVKDKFGMFVSVGIVAILTLQVVINVGMVMGLFPIVGLTLPFVSYGRSSFLIFIIMMGFLLNLSKRRTIF